MNDVTQVLYVSSRKRSIPVSINQSELEMLAHFDDENGIDHGNPQPTENDQYFLEQHSMAYIASIVEQRVLSKLKQKGSKTCSACMLVFVENEITDDKFIQYKSENSNVLPPCKSTFELIRKAEDSLIIYETQNVSMPSMLLHIMQNINIDQFYGGSAFDVDHNHKRDFIELILNSYLDIKSTQVCQVITTHSQSTRKRHHNLKEVHRLGQ